MLAVSGDLGGLSGAALSLLAVSYQELHCPWRGRVGWYWGTSYAATPMAGSDCGHYHVLHCL